MNEADERRGREALCERLDRAWLGPTPALRPTGGPLPLPLQALTTTTAAPADLPAIASLLGRGAPGVLVLGTHGSGKSTLARGVARALLDLHRADPTAPLPVLLDPSTWTDPSEPLPRWVARALVNRYCLDRDLAWRWLDERRLVLICDGLDEQPPALRDAFVTALNTSGLPRLLTCREADWRRQQVRGDWQLAVRTRALEPEATAAALGMSGASQAEQRLFGRDPALFEQLRDPLWLALFLQLRAARPELVQSSRVALPERLFNGLLEGALAAHPSQDHERALAGLTWLARAQTRAGQAEVWLHELSIAWLPERHLRVAARLLALTIALTVGLLAHLTALPLAGTPTTHAALLGLATTALTVALIGTTEVEASEPRRWSWRRVGRLLPAAVLTGAGLGALAGRLHGASSASMAQGALAGLLLLPAYATRSSARTRPLAAHRVLVDSLRAATLSALCAGGTLGLGLHLAAPWPGSSAPPVALALAVAQVMFLVRGGWAVIVHAAIRLVLALSTPLPLRLSPWLDGWTHHGLLLPVGAGWAFRHGAVQEWLSAEPPPSAPSSALPIWAENPTAHPLAAPSAIARGAPPGPEHAHPA